MKRFLVAIFSALSCGGAVAQQAAPSKTCVMQYQATEASIASLVGAGHSIVAAVAGGVWLQKEREAHYCTSVRIDEKETICWKVREPLKGQPCQ